MKVAICFSGQIRNLDKTFQSIDQLFQNSFENYKIFAHIPKDKSSSKFNDYFPSSVTLIENDQYFIGTKLKANQFKSVKHKFNSLRKARHAHMLQLYGIFKANELKIKYEDKHSFKYDWVMRCRSDLKFYSEKININELNNSNVYTANFHQFEGINDRLVLSSSENMDIFCDLFNYLKNESIEGFNAETIFKNYMYKKKLINKEIDIKFNRIRQDKTELKDF